MNAIAAGRPMADRPISRRRMLSIAAGGATALLAGKHAHADADPYVWEGTALGAPARLVLFGASREEARSAAIACLGEVERLERQFSLYRPDSALSLLNRLGSLERPPLDLLHLFDLSVRFGHLTDGAFDITVQPLWRAYADYFAGEAASPAGPPETSVRAALARVDFRRLGISSERITLADGMAVTLNGIAQGYITDRVADLLRARGWRHVLADLGEMRTLGSAPDGSPWPVAIRVPPGVQRQPTRVEIIDGAVATSAGYATVFEWSGRAHHLFSPQTGRSAGSFASITVTAPRATTADALSTALYVLPPERIASVLSRVPGTSAYLTDVSGEVRRASAG